MALASSSLLADIEVNGFAVVDDLITDDNAESLRTAFSHVGDAKSVRRRAGVYGIRNVFELVPQALELARSETVREAAEAILGPECFAVRFIFFDKLADANWMVPWHQDLSIAVKRRIDVEGFGSWSEKAGVTHVQPPVSILERMVTLRIHLDNCDETNGALHVIPGSHAMGRVGAREMTALRQSERSVVCKVPTGGCLMMRPLIAHASMPSQRPDHRRVIHIEFAAELLPGGLEWYERVRRGRV